MTRCLSEAFPAYNTFFRRFDKLASFGCNRAKEGEFAMKREKRHLVPDSSEWQLTIEGMNSFRNCLIQTGIPTEDVILNSIKML